MRFNGEDRPEVLPANQCQELPEGEIPFSHRKVLIGRAVVIVEVDLTQPVADAMVELRRWVREQAISWTRHRHGRLLD